MATCDLVAGPGAFAQEKFFLQDIDPGNGLVLYFGGGPGDRKMNSCQDGAKALGFPAFEVKTSSSAAISMLLARNAFNFGLVGSLGKSSDCCGLLSAPPWVLLVVRLCQAAKRPSRFRRDPISTLTDLAEAPNATEFCILHK